MNDWYANGGHDTEPEGFVPPRADRATCEILGWPIFAPGVYKQSGEYFSPADVKRIADNFTRYSTGDNPPLRPLIKLGHHRDQRYAQSLGFPSLGQIVAAHLDPDSRAFIIDRAVGIPRIIGSAINSGRLVSGSVELPPKGVWRPPDDPAADIEGDILSGVALLGEEMPGVPGFDAPRAVFADGTPVPPLTDEEEIWWLEHMAPVLAEPSDGAGNAASEDYSARTLCFSAANFERDMAAFAADASGHEHDEVGRFAKAAHEQADSYAKEAKRIANAPGGNPDAAKAHGEAAHALRETAKAHEALDAEKAKHAEPAKRVDAANAKVGHAESDVAAAKEKESAAATKVAALKAGGDPKERLAKLKEQLAASKKKTFSTTEQPVDPKQEKLIALGLTPEQTEGVMMIFATPEPAIAEVPPVADPLVAPVAPPADSLPPEVAMAATQNTESEKKEKDMDENFAAECKKMFAAIETRMSAMEASESAKKDKDASETMAAFGALADQVVARSMKKAGPERLKVSKELLLKELATGTFASADARKAMFTEWAKGWDSEPEHPAFAHQVQTNAAPGKVQLSPLGMSIVNSKHFQQTNPNLVKKIREKAIVTA